MKKLQLIIFCLIIALSVVACSETKKKTDDAAKSPDQKKECPPCPQAAPPGGTQPGPTQPGGTQTGGPTQPDAKPEPTKQEPGSKTEEPPKTGSTDPKT